MEQSTGAVSRQSKMKKVKEQFEKWRKNRRSRREPIPERLWEAAVSLYGEYRISEISKELRLGGGTLKKRILDAAEKKTARTPAFIALDIQKPQVRESEWSIEIENVNGEKMKISGNESAMPDFALVCQSFLRGDGCCR